MQCNKIFPDINIDFNVESEIKIQYQLSNQNPKADLILINLL